MREKITKRTVEAIEPSVRDTFLHGVEFTAEQARNEARRVLRWLRMRLKRQSPRSA